MWTQAYVEPNSNQLGETMNQTELQHDPRASSVYTDDCTMNALEVIALDVLQHFGVVAKVKQGQVASFNGIFYSEQQVKLTLPRSDWARLPELLKAKFADAFSGKHLGKGCRLTYRDCYLFDSPNDEVFVCMIVGFPNNSQP